LYDVRAISLTKLLIPSRFNSSLLFSSPLPFFILATFLSMNFFIGKTPL
jgi:hypothetical protein